MNGWRRVQRADMRPHHCAVLPQLGAGHAEGYIETGMILEGLDPAVTVSVHAATLLGKFVGLVEPQDAELVQAQLDEKDARIAELEAELETVKKAFESIDQLVSAGFRARNKPGRPKTVKEAA